MPLQMRLTPRTMPVFEDRLTRLCQEFGVRPSVKDGKIQFIPDARFVAILSIDGTLRDDYDPTPIFTGDM